MENIKSLKEAIKEMAIELKHNKVSVDHIILYLLKNTDFDDLVSKVYKVDAKHLEKELEESLTEEYQGETGDITETYLCREFWEECSDVSTRAEIYYHILTNDKTIFSEILENESDIYGKISVKMMNGGLMFTKRAENNPMSEAEDEFLSEFGDFLSELASTPEHSGKKSRKKEPWEKYTQNISEQVKKEEKVIVLRKDIVDRTIQVLCRKDKNNPIHIGEPGVGKTTICLGIADAINRNAVPDSLKNSTIISVDLPGMLAGATYRGEFEERLKNLLDNVTESIEKPILYFDEIHMIVGTGASMESSMDAANILKPYLLDGKIRFIGATTSNEYEKYILKDKAFARRFQPVSVNEPSKEEAFKILKGLKKEYETYHKVTYSDAALKAAIDLSVRYDKERFLPDKAIDVIDETGALVQTGVIKKSIGKREIEKVAAKLFNIPEKNEEEKNPDIAGLIKKAVFGQDQAADVISEAVMVSKAGLNPENKPVGSFLFVGPTGVGKTEIARRIAEIEHLKLLKYDMSEYSDKTAVNRFIGSSAGYVGYEEGGKLVRDVRKYPNSVVLFDEIEKAHPDIFNTMLQIMDDAALTDGTGKKADFRNCIIIMTSNAGIRKSEKKSIGFTQSTEAEEIISDEIKDIFSPEFRNRLTKIVQFNKMSESMAERIVEKEIKILKDVLRNKKVKLSVSQKAIDKIKENGINEEFGARNIQRYINDNIKTKIAKKILMETPKSISIDYDGNDFVIL